MFKEAHLVLVCHFWLNYISTFKNTSNIFDLLQINTRNSVTEYSNIILNIVLRKVFDVIEGISSIVQNLLNRNTGETEDLLERSIEWRKKVAPLMHCNPEQASDGELTALISFAVAFPNNFVALIDTYDVSRYLPIYDHLFLLIFLNHRLSFF